MAATEVTGPERYELIERIAVGGMAEVFRAVAYGAHGFEKALAIKRILPELAKEPEFEERFIGEAKLAVKLSHANVVQVLDFGRMAGTLFIAMELVDGPDLAALLRVARAAGAPIPIPAAFHMAIEIARGLDFAHQHGVVHRDVSPSNILLSRAGEVKIADFGIAQAAGDRRAIAADRRRIMGKWRYMSPEQARGAPLHTSSDVFSAAAVWFELFTGDKLFAGDDAETIIGNICRMEIPRASGLRPGLPARLDDVLRGALERDPARRPPAGEVLRALIEISYESSIVASALDVRAAVQASGAAATGRTAAPGAARAAAPLDALILDQLGASGDGAGAADAIRRTAVGPAGETGLSLIRSGVDLDGVTHWRLEAATVAAGPGALRGDRARSEAGGPGRPDLAGVAPPVAAPGWRGRFAALVATIALVGVGTAAAVQLATGPDQAATTSGAAAVVAAATSTVVIDSIPAGARITLDGRPLLRLTGTSVEVAPGRPHRIAIELDGYQRWEEPVTTAAGERVRIVAPLVAERATLRIGTRPPGATVLLDGEDLGVTPLRRDDLRPGRDRALELRLADHKPVLERVDLSAAAPVELERRLEDQFLYGHINLHIRDSWADVTLAGKPVGRAPGTLRLPVGVHRLRLYNRYSRKERVVTVEVVADRTRTYEFDL